MKPNGKLTVKKTGAKGLGIFAKQGFEIGELVVRGKPVSKTTVRTDYSFQIDFNKHTELDEPARLINHSCDPNLGIRNNAYGGYDFIARRRILAAEEITWDYCTTEFTSIAVKGKCLCNSKICRGKIDGYINLPKDVKKRYNGFVAEYLKEKNYGGCDEGV